MLLLQINMCFPQIFNAWMFAMLKNCIHSQLLKPSSYVLQTTANLELCEVDHWLRANNLSLNYNKTNFMLLPSRKHKPASFKVIINNHNISPEDNLKYLGVLLDNKS